jgi:hypothetical protein
MSDTSGTKGAPTCPRGNGRHGIGWIELVAKDLDAASAFYGSVFGWAIRDFAPGYRVFTAPSGGPAGGLRGNAPEGSPPTTPYVHVPDVAAALERIARGGGTKLTDPESIGQGLIAHFAAPGGTIYGLADVPVEIPHVPAPFGDAPRPAANTIASLEMYGGPDLTATASFFRDHFGWGTLEAMPGYMSFDPGISIGGVFQGHTPATRAVAYVFVEDVRATLTAIEAAGGKRAGEPMSMSGMATFGYFTDPSGTSVGLMGR